MQTEKRSKAVQGIELTKEQMNEQFNIATKELLQILSYNEGIKQSLQKVLLGWVGNEYIENTSQQERFETCTFFLQLSNHLEDINSKNIAFSENEIPIETYSIFLHFDRKKTNHYFKEVMYSFLLSELANDKDIRSDAVYHIQLTQEYVNKIYKIKQKAN